jgi:hypothetical protein
MEEAGVLSSALEVSEGWCGCNADETDDEGEGNEATREAKVGNWEREGEER